MGITRIPLMETLKTITKVAHGLVAVVAVRTMVKDKSSINKTIVI